jgi:two-component system, chemotaxis family, protein-glutamate methylesterase/glutaminase
MEPSSSIIVVGASAGGVTSLEQLVSGLPTDLLGAVFVVLHIPPDAVSRLPQILSRSGPLSAVHAQDGDRIRPRQIYVAPPDHHLLIDGDRIGVKKGPRENRFRPSIDALFRSAAYTYRTRVIGVVLSGVLDDGTSGLWSIKRLGGMTVVQDPEDAAHNAMPLNALEQVEIDHSLPARDMGPLLARLSRQGPAAASETVSDPSRQMEIEVAVAAGGNAFARGIMECTELSPFTCPECHGALVKLKEGTMTRFRCHTGHAFSKSALLAGVTEAVDHSLWQVTRALEECVMLLEQMARDLQERGETAEADRVLLKARDTERRASALQAITLQHEHLSEEALRDPIEAK